MPVAVDAEIRVFSKREFHLLAEQVTGIAFDIHNDLGRLLDEDSYANALRARCVARGMVPGHREVAISLQHTDYLVTYYMDLLLCHGLMVETKTVESLTGSHHTQALQYLMLTGMKHGLILDFRPERVERRFVSTRLTWADRRNFRVLDDHWRPRDDASRRLHELFIALLGDWGAFLQTCVYRNALIHFFGGSFIALRRTLVYDADTVVGDHEVFLISEGTAVAITAFRAGVEPMRVHLERFRIHTRLATIQWINLNGRDIEFRTLAE